ncbi:hypothetical protein PanWU01x14_030360 [Parasponia andersonii]|uniref:Secreted protein n=1 Tax=Parasponia andersonii TaxID=3476 RepID=A0A2P5DUS6_PARAD|nr:hypothetical protein PanWU01x14_030360 [Parasponia andersonii]
MGKKWCLSATVIRIALDSQTVSAAVPGVVVPFLPGSWRAMLIAGISATPMVPHCHDTVLQCHVLEKSGVAVPLHSTVAPHLQANGATAPVLLPVS